ncbi:MAG TPA: type II secretion system protein GspF [Syntrophus sp. (in: bacteria)]|nr:type II secretion system protein GspF [Syntrophus sp. (in: bacteria)]
MPIYEYIALNTRGNKQKGMIDAVNIATARQKLKESELFLVDISEPQARKREASDSKAAGVNLFKRVGLNDIALMTRQLSTLQGAGLPLVPSLTTLVTQTANPQLKAILSKVRESVNEGNSLTTGMSNFPKIFPPVYINMVRAGEASGTMNLVLGRLADFMEGQQALRTKIKSALAYPILMFLIGTVVIFFLVAFVVPSITKIFQEMHQTLPAITVLLMTTSSFLKNFWWLIALLFSLIYIAARYGIKKTDEGRLFWDRLKLKTPLVGPLIQKIAMVRFSRTLGTLLQSGVPLLSAMEIVKNVVNNRIIANAIANAGKDIEEGHNLSSPLLKSGLFPPIAIEMISVGEQTGNLEDMLYRIADSYEREVEGNILMLTSLLEPIMILVMGLVVGFIVISILLPIFEMNQLVR